MTPLGEALEQHRQARGMTKTEAYRAAGMQSHVLWNRLLTERRKFDPVMVGRAAVAVGMDYQEALRLAGAAFVPDEATRIMRMSEVRAVGEVLALKTAS